MSADVHECPLISEKKCPMDEKMFQTTAWVSFLDIYGFKAIVTVEPADKLANKLFTAHAKVLEKLSSMNSPVKRFAFSDSIFLVYPVNNNNQSEKLQQLKWCVEDTALVSNIFSADYQLPLRGGIAYGDVCYTEYLLIGQAVVEAVKNEGLLPCPAVILPAEELKLDSKSTLCLPSILKLRDVKVKPNGIRRGGSNIPPPNK